MYRNTGIALMTLGIGTAVSACQSSLPPTTSISTVSATAGSRVDVPSSPPVTLVPPVIQPPLPPATTEIIAGTGSFYNRRRRSAGPVFSSQDRTITLDFVNANVEDVAKAVLGDFLKLNYVVAANVQGTITLQTSQPLARKAVLSAMETAFQVAGLAIVESHGLYRVVPLADAARNDPSIQISGAAAQTPGFGVEIVPLRYADAAEVQHMLESVAPAGSLLRADSGRNLLFIGGTSDERAALRDNIRLFDVDWLAGMSYAMFNLRAADAKTMVSELTQVLGGG